MHLHTHALYSKFDKMHVFGSYIVKIKNQDQLYLRNETSQQSPISNPSYIVLCKLKKEKKNWIVDTRQNRCVFCLYPIFKSQNVQKGKTVDIVFHLSLEFHFESGVIFVFKSGGQFHFHFLVQGRFLHVIKFWVHPL